MSLMLRKSCQEVLDANKLGNYHASITDTYHRLAIVSECGKPFVVIQGVQFSRTTPTNNEIVYATELLEDFLATHKLLLDNYHTALDKFNKMKEVPKEKNKYISASDNTYDSSSKYKFHAYFTDGIITCKLSYQKKKLQVIISSFTNKTTLKQVEAYKVNTKIRIEAENHLKAFSDYQIARITVNKLLQSVSSCNI